MSNYTHVNNSTGDKRSNYLPPKNWILGVAFKVLCMIAVSRTDLAHWENTTSETWQSHVKVMINRFHNSNLTAGLVLATTAVLLFSNPSDTHWTPEHPGTTASYTLALVAFGAALLSVISGAAVLVIYETGTAHRDMQSLKNMTRVRILCLLAWLAGPTVCLTVATACLFGSIVIACFWTGDILIKTLTSVGVLVFFVNGFLSVYVFVAVGDVFPSSGPDKARISA